jgi:hypothetical protein
MFRSISATLFIATATLSACALDDGTDPDELSESAQDIHGPDAVIATQSHANRAVALLRGADGGRYCTGTLVKNNHVVTAAHCNPLPGDRVAFYTVPDQFDVNRIRTIINVDMRPGVHPSTDDYVDTSGRWADIAIVQLNATVGAPAVIAALDFTQPTVGELGAKVGAGGDGAPEPNDNSNSNGTLNRIGDTVRAIEMDGSYVLTTHDYVNHGDSGGPLYTAMNGAGLWVSAILSIWDSGDGVKRAGYTSVPGHLNWILDAMEYAWVGGATQNAYRSGGTLHSVSFGVSLEVCKYTCERTSACAAFNYSPALNQCMVMSSAGTAVSSSSWISDLKP